MNDKDELEELFAWGAKFAKENGITPEKSRELLKKAREMLKKEN